MDWCTKQYTTEAPTLYSARNNLSHIDPDHRGALGDILFFLLRKIIVIRLFKKHILVCVWLFHEGVAAVHSTQSSPIICGSRVFLISVFCVSCRSPSQFLFFTLCVLGNKFFTFRAFVSWETCNTVFPGMRPAPGSGRDELISHALRFPTYQYQNSKIIITKYHEQCLCIFFLEHLFHRCQRKGDWIGVVGQKHLSLPLTNVFLRP